MNFIPSPKRSGHVVPFLFLICLSSFLHAQPKSTIDVKDYERINLGTLINSSGVEIIPVISPDGKTLYFDRKYDSANVGGIEDEDDIYFSVLNGDGTWSPARNIGPPLNTRGSDILFWISPDGETALLQHGDLASQRNHGLGISRRENGAWGKPEPISIEGLDNVGDSYYATISPDGRRLLVAFAPDSLNPDNFDIYYCPARSTDYLQWGSPVRLGPDVNSLQFDGAPFLSADNRTLYFASEGHQQFGGSDIFMSRRLGDGWDNWSEAQNLSPFVNTPGVEVSLSISAMGEYGYMSALGEHGRTDIYRVKLFDSLRPWKLLAVAGTLSADGRGVSGLIRAERLSDGKEIASTASSTTGGFRLFLPLGGEYRLVGWNPEYDQVIRTIDARGDSSREIRVALSFGEEGSPGTQVVNNGTPPNLVVSNFGVGSADLPKNAVPLLGTLRARLGTIPRGSTLYLELVGYTDNSADEKSNKDLSLRRARAVQDWFLANGASQSQITVEGRGDTAPMESNDASDGRARNRRVEIRATIAPSQK